MSEEQHEIPAINEPEEKTDLTSIISVKHFSKLQFPSLLLDENIYYHVYKTPNDYQEILAENAGDAVEKSGLKNPYKILLYRPSDNNVIAAKEIRSLNT